MKYIYVVGNKFKSFAKHNNVITLLELENIIENQNTNEVNTKYILGQGISKAKKDHLVSSLYNKNYNCIINKLESNHDNKDFVHKAQDNNVLISKPLKINPELFISQLIIDDSCSEMQDHQTGEHIQGMVLTEAARQVALSISEHYLLLPEERFCKYFILNGFSAIFHNFVFPIEVEIRCSLTKLKHIPVNNIKVSLLVEFIQNGKSVTEVNIIVTALQKLILEAKEHELAINCLNKYQEEV